MKMNTKTSSKLNLRCFLGYHRYEVRTCTTEVCLDCGKKHIWRTEDEWEKNVVKGRGLVDKTMFPSMLLKDKGKKYLRPLKEVKK